MYRTKLMVSAVCLSLVSVTTHGDVLGITGVTLDPPAVGGNVSTASASTLLSYTNSAGTRTDVNAVDSVISATVKAYTDPGDPSDVFQNVWVLNLPEIDGPDAVLGLNMSHGLANINDLRVDFDTEITGDTEIFFFEMGALGGVDGVVNVRPIDSAGAIIADYQIDLTSADMGTSVQWNQFNFDGGGSGANVWDIGGVSFTVADFVYTGAGVDPGLSGVEGIQLFNGLAADIITVGYATTAVPEPSSVGLIASGLVLVIGRKRK